MANNKTLNRLANYQIISDLLGTFLDYSQSEREMVLKYTQGDDTKRQIVKENGINYFADDGSRVLDADAPGVDASRSHAKDRNGQLRYLDGEKELVFPNVELAEKPLTKADMAQDESGVWKNIHTGENIFDGSTVSVSKNHKFDLKNGTMLTWDDNDPNGTITNTPIPGYEDIKNSGISTDIVKDKGEWVMLNSVTGEEINRGSIHQGGGVDNKAAAKGYLDNLVSAHSDIDKGVLNQLYSTIEADVDGVTDDELTQFKSIADKQVKAVKDKNIKVNQTKADNLLKAQNQRLNAYSKFVNQGIMDKFGAGPDGTVLRMTGDNVDFAIAKGQSSPWTPGRANGMLIRMSKHEETTNTGLGVVSFDEGMSLIQDQWLDKYTNFKETFKEGTNNTGGHEPVEGGFKSGYKTGGSTAQPQTVMFDAQKTDGGGEKWGKVGNDLYYFHSGYNKWYKVTGEIKDTRKTIDGKKNPAYGTVTHSFKDMWETDLNTQDLYNYVNTEMGKYNYIDR